MKASQFSAFLHQRAKSGKDKITEDAHYLVLEDGYRIRDLGFEKTIERTDLPAKAAGLAVNVRSVNMDFIYGSAFSVDSPDAYETLILDALLGDASLFTRADEAETAWGLVTPIIDAWLDQPPPVFPSYEAGSWGPAAADALLARDGRSWRRI